jgi:carbonic anhydrase
MVEGELPELRVDYRAGGSEIVNNGHTIQVNYAPGSSATVAGRRYELLQFHFHAPSENLVEGHSFPLEGHLVHKDSDGNLLVIAVMYSEGAASDELAKAWRQMPAKAGERNSLSAAVNAHGLLPASLDYYRFSGSLTTPPCSEGVTWIVLKKTEAVSEGQVAAFSQTLGHSNNRPVQPVNARIIVQ